MKKAELIKYLVVDINTGKWEWDKNLEHHSIAVPKMLNNLDNRIKKLIFDFSKEIKNGMLENVHTRILRTNKIDERLEDVKEELYLHFYMLNDFKKKVLKNLESEENKKLSPLLSLKNMNTDGSPLLSRKRSTSFSHMYDRYENSEIRKKLDKSQENISTTIEIIQKARECWRDLNLLNNSYNSEKLYNVMKDVSDKLKSLKNSSYEEFNDLYEAFFAFDDATRGLVHLHNFKPVKIRKDEILNSLEDYIRRNLILCIDEYNKSEEKENIEKAIEKLKQYRILEYQDIILNGVLGVKTILETNPVEKASLKTCFKKVGEFHSNLHQKIFELQALNYLQNYLTEETRILYKSVSEQIREIHEKFIDKNEEITFEKENKNIRELEVYRMVLEDLLLQTDAGKIYFFLNNKLHNLNSKFLSKYFEFNEDKLFQSLEILGSDNFRDFIEICNDLMIELRKELKNNVEISQEDLLKIGIATSKTTMITSYNKAIEEILAGLGTFMGNTLHSLVKEILQNLPYSEGKYRNMMKTTYIKIEDCLNIFNKDSYSEEYIQNKENKEVIESQENKEVIESQENKEESKEEKEDKENSSDSGDLVSSLSSLSSESD
jgi:hypothetical protein